MPAAPPSPTPRRRSPACRRSPGRAKPPSCCCGGGRSRRARSHRAGRLGRGYPATPAAPCQALFPQKQRPASPSRSISSPPLSSCSPAGTSSPATSATSTAACRTAPACSPASRRCASRSPSSTPTAACSALCWRRASRSSARIRCPRPAGCGVAAHPVTRIRRRHPRWRAGGAAAGGYAVALTHDLDNLWRWTPRGFAASGYRGARAARRRDGAASAPRARRPAASGSPCTCRGAAIPSGPSRSFWAARTCAASRRPSIVIASHAHPTDGNQPDTYQRRIPEALMMLARSRQRGRAARQRP